MIYQLISVPLILDNLISLFLLVLYDQSDLFYFTLDVGLYI